MQKTNDDGMIVVETTLLFIPFVILMSIILILVNVVTLQSRIHYAMSQAAAAVSMYDYTLHAMGADTVIMKNEERSDSVRDEADEFKEQMTGLISALEKLNIESVISYGGEGIRNVSGWVTDTAEDPKNALALIINYALSEAGNAVFAEVMRPLIGRYLSNGTETGDEYLRNVGVLKGLDGLDMYSFSLFDLTDTPGITSTLLTSKGDLRLVCKYEVYLAKGVLPFPIGSIEVTQYVKTKAWLSGRGEGYK